MRCSAIPQNGPSPPTPARVAGPVPFARADLIVEAHRIRPQHSPHSTGAQRCADRLLNHLVGRGQQRFRDGEAERLSGPEIDHELELGRLLWRSLIRTQPRDVLLVEKAANLGINFRHLGIGKSAVLAARDCDKHVADTGVVQRPVQADILRVGNGRVSVSLDRNDRR